MLFDLTRMTAAALAKRFKHYAYFTVMSFYFFFFNLTFSVSVVAATAVRREETLTSGDEPNDVSGLGRRCNFLRFSPLVCACVVSRPRRRVFDFLDDSVALSLSLSMSIYVSLCLRVRLLSHSLSFRTRVPATCNLFISFYFFFFLFSLLAAH
jgi:hypothetical protein